MTVKQSLSEIELLQRLNEELAESRACPGMVIRRLTRIVSSAQNWEPELKPAGGPPLTEDCEREIVAATLRLGEKYDLADEN
jgi:hypothetical protein